MTETSLKIQNIPTDKLVEYARNPRKNDAVVDKMVACIKEFGFRIPIVAKSDGTVVDGHLRLKAARKMGLKEVPVVNADDLTEAQIKAFRLVANQSANWAEWDEELLKLEFKELDDLNFDLELTGFDLEDIQKQLDELEGKTVEEDDFDENEISQDETPVITKPDDLWILGEHRLLCGDATKIEDIERLMNGEKADMVFTDPPYGMKKEKDGILNDNLNYDKLLKFNQQWIPLTFLNTKDNGSWYCWGIDEPLMDIYSNILKPMILENKITFRNLITWKKENNNPTMLFNGACSSNKRSYYTNEKCLFVMCGVQGFNNNADHYDDTFEPIRFYLESQAKKVNLSSNKLKEICGVGMYARWFTKSQFSIITEEHYKKLQNYFKEKAFELDYNDLRKLFNDEKFKTLKATIMAKRAYFDGTKDQCIDVWCSDVTSQEERQQTGGHATPKPIALCSRAIKSSSREQEIILDVFGGSGSTLIACEQLKRKCYMMELEPKYCDVIIRRWQKQTNQQAILEANGKSFNELSEKDG